MNPKLDPNKTSLEPNPLVGSTGLSTTDVPMPDENTTTSDTAPKDGSSDAFFKAVEKIPYAGPTLVFIIKKWGWAGLGLFFVGFLLSAVLIKFHALPEWFVSDRYKRAATAAAPQPATRVKVQDFAVELLSDEPNWIKTQLGFLKEEGVLRQSADKDLKFSVKAVQYTFPEATDDFRWLLITEKNFDLSAIAFMVTDHGLKLQPLESANSDHSIEFKVPKCEKGDKLLALVRIQYKGTEPITDIRSVFRTSVVR
jgi:hypothetical protein